MLNAAVRDSFLIFEAPLRYIDGSASLNVPFGLPYPAICGHGERNETERPRGKANFSTCSHYSTMKIKFRCELSDSQSESKAKSEGVDTSLDKA